MVGIRDAAARTGLSADTLRYYERIGLIEDVTRDGAGHRQYGDQDLRWLEFLLKLRRTGMHIHQMTAYARLVRQGPHTQAARQAMLEAHRDEVVARIAELTEHLSALDYKIALYRDGGMT
ncbi:MAG: MerR family transcriptional regulator [Alphaproteobacteria bacterium]|nr:MerR family transcriptional regulator [Alphaproteobacteria bacterium]